MSVDAGAGFHKPRGPHPAGLPVLTLCPLHSQAQARCHRIGQSKAVKVYRLITRNSYEREMFDKASLKLGLDKAVLQDINRKGSTNGVGWLLEGGQWEPLQESFPLLPASHCQVRAGTRQALGRESPVPHTRSAALWPARLFLHCHGDRGHMMLCPGWHGLKFLTVPQEEF